MAELTLESLARQVEELREKVERLEAADTPPPQPAPRPLPPALVEFLRRAQEEAAAAGGTAKTLMERWPSLVGVSVDLPPDASTQVDHYLYGTPKR